jgi:hypothetical protein
MASAKKGAKRGRKTVSVVVDEATLKGLAEAAGALSALAAALVDAADDPVVRRRLKKARKRS